MSTDIEQDRYVQYMQRSLVAEGTEEFLRKQRQWLQDKKFEHANQIRAISKEPSEKLEAWARSLLDHQDEGEHDCIWARNIFEPLLEQTLAICREADKVLKNPVRFANSPAIDVSPSSLPSQHQHILFAGQGTFAFCNYWAKVFSTAIHAVATKCGTTCTSEEIAACLKGSKVIGDAARLAFRYASTGTLVGFGKLEQEKELTIGRTLLVNSMEIFAVAHEVGHFFNHEEHPGTNGLAPGDSLKDLELDCDALALTVCSAYGQREDNIFASHLIGPLLFFYALRICDKAAERLFGEHRNHDSDSHPTHAERIHAILAFLDYVVADPVAVGGAQFAMEIAMVIGSQLQLLWDEVSDESVDLGEDQAGPSLPATSP